MGTKFLHIEDRLIPVNFREAEVRGEPTEIDILNRRGDVAITAKGRSRIEAARKAIQYLQLDEDGIE